jgi:hypothetical protein
MGSDDTAKTREAQSREADAENWPSRKPYVKPELRRLGTVQELTHGNPSKGVK